MATAGNTYFVRSLLLHQEGGLYITRQILEREIERKKGESSLTTLLRKCEDKLKYQYHGKQYKKLFPEYGDTDIYKWDLQLSVGVLLHVFRGTLTLTERQKLSALKELRNEIYMHCASPSLTLKQYEDVREELEDILTSLATKFDVSVKERCVSLISQFATGPLDGVRPSLATLNGFNQACQKKFQVSVDVELVVCGPSDHWTDLCEHILDTILNNAVSVANEGDEFEEIEKRVKEMLASLQANKDVVFKGSKKECVVMLFECGSYDDFLQFVEIFDRQELQFHLDMISEGLMGYYKLSSPVHISCRIRTESLQFALVNAIKMENFEEEIVIPRLEMSSKEVIDDAKSLTRHVPSLDGELCNKTESNQLLRLELECSSIEGLSHTLSSFKKDEFSDHLTSVADALSRHVGQKITLKASLNVQECMEAIEESAESKRIDMTDRLVKLYPVLIEEIYVENIADHLKDRGFLSLSEFEDVCTHRKRRDRVDTLLRKVLTGPFERQMEFIRALRLHGYEHLAEVVENSTVSFEDLLVDNEILNLKVRLVKKYPNLENKYDVENIADHLLYKGLLPFYTMDERSEWTSNEILDMLLQKVVKGPLVLKGEFMNALRKHEYRYFSMDVKNKTVTDADLLADLEIFFKTRRLVKKYSCLEEKYFVEEIVDCLHDRGLLSFSEYQDVCSLKTSNKTWNVLLQKVVKAPMEMKGEFIRILRKHESQVFGMDTISDAELLDDIAFSNLRASLLKKYPFLKGKIPVEEIAGRLHDCGLMSFFEITNVRSQRTRSEKLQVLLDEVLKGPIRLQTEFVRVLRMHDSGHLVEVVEQPKLKDAPLIADREMLNLKVCLVKQYPILKEELYVEHIADHLRHKGLLSIYEIEDVRSQLKRSNQVDMLLQKVLNGQVKMLREFTRALTMYGYMHLENPKIREADLNVFSRLEQSSILKDPRSDSDTPRIQLSESSRRSLIENLSPNVIETISDHLLSRLVFSTTEHTDILFPPLSSNRQTVFLETLEKCSVEVLRDLYELLNSFGLSHLGLELDWTLQSDKTSEQKFEKSSFLSREVKTAKGSTTKLDKSFRDKDFVQK